MARELKHIDVGNELSKTEWLSIDSHIINGGVTGDVLYQNGSGNIVGLPVGSSNSLLTVSGGLPYWTETPSLTSLEIIESKDSATSIIVENVNTGTGAYSVLEIRNDTAISDAITIRALGKSYTTNGAFRQDTGLVEAGTNLSGGLNLMTRNASGVMRFFTGGFANGNERMTIASNGEITISNDLDVTGEIKGCRQNVMLLHIASTGTIGDGDEVYLELGGLSVEDRGVPMLRAGSITGISIAYDNTAASGEIDDLFLRVLKDGTSVFSNSLVGAFSENTGLSEYFTQARGLDTFAAGDLIGVSLNGSDAASDNTTLANIVVLIEFVYDD